MRPHCSWRPYSTTSYTNKIVTAFMSPENHHSYTYPNTDQGVVSATTVSGGGEGVGGQMSDQSWCLSMRVYGDKLSSTAA